MTKKRTERITDKNSFGKNCEPHLLEEWDYEKNKDIVDPFQITFGNSIKVWWICKDCGHSWETKICNRTSSHTTKCPVCAKKRNGVKKIISINYPHLLKEWDYEKNDFGPDDRGAHTNIRVLWKCEEHGSYQKNIIDRTKHNRGCPQCKSGLTKKIRQTIPKKIFFKESHPDIFKNINLEKHKFEDIENIGSYDQIVISFKCTLCEYEWINTPFNLIGNKKICPRCHKDYWSVIKYLDQNKYDNINIINPNFATSYHFKFPKCGHEVYITVRHFLEQLEKKVCSICEKEKREKEIVNLYSKTTSLKEISNKVSMSKQYIRKILIEKGLYKNVKIYPIETAFDAGYLKHLDYEKNEDTDYIKRLSKGSDKQIYFKCIHCNNEWKGKIQSNNKCFKCEISFGAKFPELLKEWDYEKNIIDPFEIKPHINIRVFWKCTNENCKNEWDTLVAQRTKGKNPSGCPKCNSNKVSGIERKFFYFLEKIFSSGNVKNSYSFKPKKGRVQEIDIFIESLNLAVEYDGEYFHKERYKTDIQKTKTLEDNGMFVIRIREDGLKKINDYDINHNFNKTPFNQTFFKLMDIIEKRYTLTKKQKKILDKLKDKDLENYKLPKQYLKYPLVQNALSSTHTHVAKMWDYEKNYPITPDMITSTNPKKYSWIYSDCNHNFKATTITMVKNGSCKVCEKLKILKEKLPQLQSLWNDEKNGPIDKEVLMYKNKYWWKCECGEEWEGDIKSLIFNNGKCSKCSSSSLNDHPHIAKFWDHEKNFKKFKVKIQDVKLSDERRFYWTCPDCKTTKLWIIKTIRKKKGKCINCNKKSVYGHSIKILEEKSLFAKFPS